MAAAPPVKRCPQHYGSVLQGPVGSRRDPRAQGWKCPSKLYGSFDPVSQKTLHLLDKCLSLIDARCGI